MLALTPLQTQGSRGWVRALLIIGGATMSAAWLSVWVALLAMAAGLPMILPGLAQEAIVLVGAFVARWLQTGTLSERLARAIFTVAALSMAVVVTVTRLWPLPNVQQLLPGAGSTGREVIIALTTLALWWMGGWIGASPLDDGEVFRSFVMGLIGLFAGLG